jgi:anhydro-N-acetylmuramic acid kinase
MLSIGLMSGTSMDGIDGALIKTDGKYVIKLIASITYDYPGPFKILLRIAEAAVREHLGDTDLSDAEFMRIAKRYITTELAQSEQAIQTTLKTLVEFLDKPLSLPAIIQRSTEEHVHCVTRLLRAANVIAADVSVIGYHGQNLYHNPSLQKSVQVGSADYLMEQTHIPVIHRFRIADVEAQGQGAPLAPLYHFALAMRDHKIPAIVVNCGGISNATVIPSTDVTQVIGFDLGPGNTLLDRFVRLRSQGKTHMDKDGLLASTGKVDQNVLTLCMNSAIRSHDQNYLNLPPPKSLDTSQLILLPELASLSLEDGCRTLAAFTAEAIVHSIGALGPLPIHWILSGGGWKNPVICQELSERLNAHTPQAYVIQQSDDLGWQSQSIEAELFAYLAVRRQLNLPTSYPNLTGATHPISGGCIHTCNLRGTAGKRVSGCNEWSF